VRGLLVQEGALAAVKAWDAAGPSPNRCACADRDCYMEGSREATGINVRGDEEG